MSIFYIAILVFVFIFALLLGMFLVILKYRPKQTKSKSYNTSVGNVLKGVTPASDEEFLTEGQSQKSSVDNFSSSDKFAR